MKKNQTYSDINGIPVFEMELIGSLLLFNIAKVLDLYSLTLYYYNLGFLPFIDKEDELIGTIETIGEIFISSCIAGDNVDNFDTKDSFYKKSRNGSSKIGFSKDDYFNVKIEDHFLINTCKIGLVYLANGIINFDFVDAEKLILTSYNKFNFDKKELIKISSKIPRYASDTLLTLVNAGLLKFVDKKEK